MREVCVETWSELQEELFRESWDERLRRYRSRFAFRGMARASDALVSSLSSLGPDAAGLEAPILRTFRKYARGVTAVEDDTWSWLAVAQHHGLPTRLLDWTFSPYVALHFMTEDPACFDVDGAVWAVDFIGAKRALPARLRGLLDDEEANVFTGEILGRAARSLGELDALSESEPFVAFFEPPSLDERIVNQHALFSLTSRADGALGGWLEAHPELGRRVVVPASLKWEVRDKLDQANVTERVLYPGLDGLTRWMRRYYAPRP